MQSTSISPEDYIHTLPEERKAAFAELWNQIKKNLPEGSQEVFSGGMPGFVVSHSVYPAGYHCNPSAPLPFISIANQKNFIALYHMGLYANKELLDWFTSAYPRHSKAKLDMSKSCIRFKKPGAIPFELVGELASKMDVDEWIRTYEAEIKV